ncbi:ATP-binding cassette domain-containing protein, partial [Hungatella hathewayi]
RYRRYIGMVFQDFCLFPDFTVYENVAFAQRVVEADHKRMRSRVMEVLGQVGLEKKAGCYPGQLSGGEKQRTALARAVVNQPVLLLADEPTGNLDQKNAEEIMRLLEKINRQGTTVLVVSHNQELVKYMHRRQIALRYGKVIKDSSRGGLMYGC